MIRFAAIAAALALATPAVAAQQFDLVCQGTVSGLRGSDPQPWSARYAIDLTAGAWCKAPCASPEPIARVEPGKLWLRDDSNGRRGPAGLPAVVIDRVTGAMKAQDGLDHYSTAVCQLSPFTAFPKSQF